MGRIVSTVATSSDAAEITHLVGCDCEGMNVGLFSGEAPFQPFRCHITNIAIFAGRSASLWRDVGVIDNLHDAEVSNTGFAIMCDQNVPLNMKTRLAQTRCQEIMITHWINTAVHNF